MVGSLLLLSKNFLINLRRYISGDQAEAQQRFMNVHSGLELNMKLRRLFTYTINVSVFQYSLECTKWIKITIRAIKCLVAEHERRYNAPATDEIRNYNGGWTTWHYFATKKWIFAVYFWNSQSMIHSNTYSSSKMDILSSYGRKSQKQDKILFSQLVVKASIIISWCRITLSKFCIAQSTVSLQRSKTPSQRVSWIWH